MQMYDCRPVSFVGRMIGSETYRALAKVFLGLLVGHLGSAGIFSEGFIELVCLMCF